MGFVVNWLNASMEAWKGGMGPTYGWMHGLMRDVLKIDFRGVCCCTGEGDCCGGGLWWCGEWRGDAM